MIPPVVISLPTRHSTDLDTATALEKQLHGDEVAKIAAAQGCSVRRIGMMASPSTTTMMTPRRRRRGRRRASVDSPAPAPWQNPKNVSCLPLPLSLRSTRPRRQIRFTSMLYTISAILWMLLGLSLPARAASIEFNNCLNPNIINSNPRQLQFVPFVVNATFDTKNPSHRLSVAVYGNISGSATVEPPPPPTDPQWNNPNQTRGKILDLYRSNNKFSTLFAKYNVLTYTPYSLDGTRFCQSLVGPEKCPLRPIFDAKKYEPPFPRR